MEHIIQSPFPKVYIPENMTITDFLFMTFQNFGDQPAMIDGFSGKSLTFADLITFSQGFGSALYRRGLRKGDTVMIVSPNSVEYPVCIFGTLYMGGILTTCNPLYTTDDIIDQMNDCQPTFVVTVPMFMEKVGAAAKKYGKIKHIITVGACPGCLSFDALMKESGPKVPLPDINVREDVALLPYSSGTTGKPKGVMLTHYNIVANMCQSLPTAEVLGPGTVSVCVLPFFHIYGAVVILQLGLSQGTCLLTMPMFDLPAYLGAVQKYKGTHLFLVPPLAILLAKHPLVEKFDLSSVQMVYCGAAPLGKEVNDQLLKRLNITQELRQGYGMTETSPVVTASTAGYAVSGSTGVAIPNTELKVIDLETGASLSSYVQGELCVRGPQVMKGYLGQPEQTKNTIDAEGWLHTGDIVYYDSRGLVYVVDRLKELIKYKAFQVAPASLEAILLQHSAVADAAVIGIPDDLAGELPRACIVLKAGKTASANEIMDFIQGRVAPHMRLRGGVQFVTEIPKSAAGKILRREVKKLVEAAKSKL